MVSSIFRQARWTAIDRFDGTPFAPKQSTSSRPLSGSDFRSGAPDHLHEAFSTFVGCQVWDHSEIFDRANLPRRILIQAQDVQLRSEDLAFLRQSFSAAATTHGWPGENQYRFERGEARILIWDGEGQADWWITAATAAGLAAVVAELRHCGTLGTTLWSTDERGTEVLVRTASE